MMALSAVEHETINDYGFDLYHFFTLNADSGEHMITNTSVEG